MGGCRGERVKTRTCGGICSGERERHGMYTVVVVATEVRERGENVIRSDEGEDRKAEENEQAKEGGRYHNRR